MKQVRKAVKPLTNAATDAFVWASKVALGFFIAAAAIGHFGLPAILVVCGGLVAFFWHKNQKSGKTEV